MINWKDVGVRSLKTFLETAFSCLIASLSGFQFGQDNADKILISMVISAGAAGLAAVYNGVVKPMLTVPVETYGEDEEDG